MDILSSNHAIVAQILLKDAFFMARENVFLHHVSIYEDCSVMRLAKCHILNISTYCEKESVISNVYVVS
jgi:hypothetical protein